MTIVQYEQGDIDALDLLADKLNEFVNELQQTKESLMMDAAALILEIDKDLDEMIEITNATLDAVYATIEEHEDAMMANEDDTMIDDYEILGDGSYQFEPTVFDEGVTGFSNLLANAISTSETGVQEEHGHFEEDDEEYSEDEDGVQWDEEGSGTIEIDTEEEEEESDYDIETFEAEDEEGPYAHVLLHKKKGY